MFFKSHCVDSRCVDTLNHAKDNQYITDMDEAKKAVKMLHDYLMDKERDYENARIYTKAFSPYYFFEVSLEREIQPLYVVNVKQGVIEYKTADARDDIVKQLLRDIKLMENDDIDPLYLAKIIVPFYSGMVDRLVTSHIPKSHRAEQNPPELKRNMDGSLTLIFDLQRDGRSLMVKQCKLNVSQSYELSFECITKQE